MYFWISLRDDVMPAKVQSIHITEKAALSCTTGRRSHARLLK
jgi:hypothetical protein